jgi:UDP-N-acetylglucosamine:LPS N-acetylglucosamine transferase
MRGIHAALRMKKVDFLYFDAGGGHRAAATALEAVIARQGRPWDVRLVNLQELLHPLDVFRKMSGVPMHDIYNLLLKKGWTYRSELLIPPMHALIRAFSPAQARLLARYWAERKPDLVVSVVPNFNRVFWRSLHKVDPAIPLVTILTDLADYPPHFWIERQPQYFICGTDRAVEQARDAGHPDGRVFRVSGMILRPIFYETNPVDRERERARLGLRPDVPTALVLFGGQGSHVMLRLARRLRECAVPVQAIFLCGRNEKLAARLRGLPECLPMHVEGFTSEIPYFMRLADFFIGKPGPGSISEALAMKLPVIVEANAWTLPQERYNAQWIRENELGLVLNNFREIAPAVEHLLAPARYSRFRENAAALQNRAVFEIPEILAQILDRRS